LRIAARVIRESLFLNLRGPRGAPRKRTILIGAGDAGAMVMRESQMNPKSPYSIIAIFDDDSSKVGLSVYGVRVVGSVNQARAYIDEQDVEMAIVAIPSCTGPQMKRILDQLSALNIEVKTLPSVVEIIESGSALNQLRDVDITDLLGRAEIYIDESSVSELLTDKVIAVTGAGGSIGRELCRQIIKKRPHALVMLDKTENSLFHVHMDLKSMGPDYENVILDMALCDIRYWPEVFDIFSRTKPDVVFHAAAHKHVTIQENNPLECFKNNVGGIQSVTRICDELSIEKFVLISTDKAVNATSIMGASKRACEMYCQAMSRISRTQFITVRFGNVLGSEGSVAPIFMNQIKRGGPVTVTHPQATRYFMTIPEAVTLVLQAASIGETGNVMLLDMGEPRKILDMAKQLIRLHGKSETTIPIEFIGLKPGEKLHEELSFDVEKLLPTAHEKVKLFESNIDDPQRVLEQIDHWIDMAFTAPYTINMQSVFKEIVPEYKPAHSNGDSQGLQLGPTAQPAFMGARSSLKYGDMI
jgi:FlaA1/EpsC-like NDP-sugar epimerase